MTTKAQFDALAASINSDLDKLGPSVPSATAEINVAAQAAAGNGDSSNPLTGWDSAITWSPFTRYKFKKGYYAYATSPNFLQPGIEIIGEAGVYLKHTGAGNAFVMDAGSVVNSNWIQNVRVKNILITGNANTTNGLFLRGVRNGIFRHIGVHDVSQAGIHTEACVTNLLENFRVTIHEPTKAFGFSVVPKYGIVTTGRGTDFSTTWTIINPVIEGVSTYGIWFTNQSYGNTLIRGTSESNVDAAVGVQVDGNNHTLEGIDVEGNNSGQDLAVTGSFNHFSNFFSAGNATFSGNQNLITGGHWNRVTNTGFYNVFIAPKIQGTVTDSQWATRWIGQTTGDATSNVGIVIPKELTFDPGATVSFDAMSADVFQINVWQALAIQNPTNPLPGRRVTIRLFPSADWPLTWGSQFRAVNGTTLPSHSGTGVSYVTAIWDASASKWDCF